MKTERVMRLNEVQRKISLVRNQAEIGKTFEVLIEKESRKNKAEWLGTTDHNKGVVFSAPDKKPGDFVHVLVAGAGTHTLMGKVV
jgi:tRNA-2-methylthio-N6-dimethylallyladenosine synthase